MTFNRNGLVIKENLPKGTRIISATKPEKENLLDVTIIHLDNNFNLVEKLFQKVLYKSKEWISYDNTTFLFNGEIFKENKTELMCN